MSGPHPIRPLYLLRYFPALTETFVHLELELLIEAGLQPQVLRLGTRPDSGLARPFGGPCWEPPRAPWTWMAALQPPTCGQRFVAAHQRQKDALRYRAALEQLRRGPLPTVVHAHFAGEAAEWAEALRLDLGLPWTLMVHAVDLRKPRPSLPVLLSGAARTLAVRSAELPALRSLGANAALLRCGPAHQPWSTLDRSPVGSGPLRALFVGRDVPKKGLDTLLAAWPQVQAHAPEATLELITDRKPNGPLLPGLRWRGLLPAAGVAEALARSNLVVLPCQRAPDGDEDGVPLVLMEAMAAGRPVLSCPVGGVTELVDDEVGWLCAPGEPTAIAQALCAATPAARARRGEAGPGRLRTRGFTLEAQVQGLRAVWDTLHAADPEGAHPRAAARR